MNKYDSFVHVSELVKLQAENKKLKLALKDLAIDLNVLDYMSDEYYENMLEEFNIE